MPIRSATIRKVNELSANGFENISAHRSTRFNAIAKNTKEALNLKCFLFVFFFPQKNVDKFKNEDKLQLDVQLSELAFCLSSK